MSGISTSGTWVIPLSSALEAARAIPTGDLSALDEFPAESFLMVTSRNNHLEYNFRELLLAFPSTGLEHFRSREEIGNQGSRPFATVLTGAALDSAIEGLDALLAALRRDPERCKSLWDTQSKFDFPDKINSLLSSPWPSTFAEAKIWLDQYQEDGESFRESVGFLHVHHLALKLAREKQLAVLYAVWLY